MNAQLSIVSALALALLHSLWQLALIGLLAALCLSAMRHASASARHAVGMAWLMAMALAPALTFVWCWQSPAMAPLAGWPSAVVRLPGSEASSGAAAVGSPRDGWLLVSLSQLWLLGVVVMSARQIGGWRWLLRMERQDFAELPTHWQVRVTALREVMGITRHVAVRLAAHAGSPFTAHVLRPLVWLPLGLLTRLPADQVEALIAHELAHIRRLDWCWNAVQCAVETLLFHHPAMWWLSRRIREEREHACDDLAVSVCGDPVALAEALAALQQHGPTRPVFVPRHGLAAEGGSLMKRISHLLARTPRRANWRAPAILLLVLGSSSLVAMQLAPPAHLLTNLLLDQSTEGPLTPGTFRAFTARYLGDPERHYRASMDAQGRLTEHYTEGGVAKPIDEGVRQWLATMTAMSTPPAPGQPTAPAETAAAPPTVEPPASEIPAVLASIAADPAVVAAVGVPLRLDRTSFHGSVHTWGSRDFHLWGIDDPVGGTAAFTVVVGGPKGRVTVRYVGKTVTGGAWQAETLDLSPAPG